MDTFHTVKSVIIIICLEFMEKPEWFFRTGVNNEAATGNILYKRCFLKFTGKHLCQSLCFNKVANLRPATLFGRRFRLRFFPVNFEKLLRTPFLQNTSMRLLLWIWKSSCSELTSHNSQEKHLWRSPFFKKVVEL